MTGKGAVCVAAISLWALSGSVLAEQGYRGTQGNAAPDEAAAAYELKRQQLAEREAAVRAKEEALRKLEASVQAKIAELNAAKKGLETSLQGKKKVDEDRFKKMIKIYKSMKPDQAAALMDKLDERTTIAMLNEMDQKTVVKLVPYLTQPRVLKWTRENLGVR